jgi:hypothetical protein
MYNAVMDKKAQILQRIQQAEYQLTHVPHAAHDQWSRFTELQYMVRNIHKMYDLMDRESVECRRLGKETTRYLEYYTKLNDSLDLLDQFIMTAIMMA